MSKKLLAELLGTFWLVLGGCGSAVLAANFGGDGNPLGIGLLGDAAPGSDWHGYQFRILEAQGASAPGGAYSYRLGDNMSRGFALVAWPAKYGDSGVTSFMISHEGQVFEKDLGANGDALARSMKAFDPDDSWQALPLESSRK